MSARAPSEVPVVSIVIPMFNSEGTLKETLTSIRAQQLIDWECIIVDDGSTDDSLFIAKKFAEMDPRFVILHRPNDRSKGAATCRNIGFDSAKGRYVQFFDSDDLMHERHLSLKVQKAEQDASDVVVCRLQEIFPRGARRANCISPESLPNDMLDGKVNWYVCGPLWRRRSINSVRFPEGISNLDDLVFNLRALRCAGRVSYVEDVLIDYIRHGGGITGSFSKASVREIASTISARSVIQRELKASGQYSDTVSASQLRGIAHLGYLVSMERSPAVMLGYSALLLRSTKVSTAVLGARILACMIVWLLTGRGYSLVGRVVR